MKHTKYRIVPKYLATGCMLALVAIFCISRGISGETLVTIFGTASKSTQSVFWIVGIVTAFLSIISLKNSFERVRTR